MAIAWACTHWTEISDHGMRLMANAMQADLHALALQ
jgi:hypothetical protein